MPGMFADLRHALRQFISAPGWSATVVGVLALGLGLALTSFMLVDALLFRPLGIVAQDRVVRVATSREYMGSASYPAYIEYRDRGDAFDGVVASGGVGARHWRQADGTRLRVAPALVSGNYFEVLGVKPMLGRTLTAADDTAGAPPVAVVSYKFWRDRLGARSDAVGSTLLLDDQMVTIVGVNAPDFMGLQPGGGPHLWQPLATGTAEREPLTSWSWHWLSVYARLRPGVTLAQADAQVDAIAQARDEKVISGDMEKRARAVPVFPRTDSSGEGELGSAAWMMVGGSLLILLCASANAAGLLLVRGERRRGELAVRSSLGANTARLARQLFAETLVLALLGSAVGLAIARGLSAAALAFGADSVLLAGGDMLPTWSRAGGVALALAMIVALVAGLLPALRPRSLAVVEELKAGGGSGGGRRWRNGRALVVLQFALTVVLVVGAGLLLRSLWVMWSAPVGVVATDARVLRLDYAAAENRSVERSNALGRRFLETLDGAPGVVAAGFASMVPISGTSMETTVKVPDRSDGSVDDVHAFYNPVSARYFDALGVKPVAGRAFDPREGAGTAPVAIVSAEFARRYFPGADPIGRHVDMSRDGKTVAEIVGVVPDIKYQSVTERWGEMVYVPYEQRIFGSDVAAVVRAAPGSDAATLASIERAWRAVEPERALPRIGTVASSIEDSIATPRFLTATLSTFAVLGLLLAAAGIYGAFAFWVSVRRRELGLRLALGASTHQLFALVLGDGLRVIVLGSALGLLAAAALGRVVAAALVGVSPYDVVTYASVILIVGTAGLLAAALPARSAARIDPQQSLRCE